MSELFFAEIPLAKGKKQEWIEEVINDPKGMALTKTMPGFISAEMAIFTDESGQDIFLLWEKWESKGDFENYNKNPDRQDESAFMQKFFSCVGGDPKMGFCETL